MTDTKKATPTPKVMKITRTKDFSERNTAVNFEVPGFVFRWVNAEYRTSRHKWKHWRPVERESEMGQLVAEQMDKEHDKFEGPNTSTNYFYRGSQAILAYAKKEDADAYRQKISNLAADQLRKVVDPEEVTMQHIMVPTSTVKQTREK